MSTLNAESAVRERYAAGAKSAEAKLCCPVDYNGQSLYSKLENIILPMFYKERSRYLAVMQHTIALNGSFFNTQRMVQQYVTDAYIR